MKIKINGEEIDIDVPRPNAPVASAEITQPICQPILRDTSPNALRAEQLKKSFNEAVLAPLSVLNNA